MTKNEKIQEIVKILTSQISIGWHHFVIAKFIREAYEKDRIKGAHTIFTNSYSACWDAAILAVAKVIDKHGDSLSLTYMFNSIEGIAKSYPTLTELEIRKQIEKHREELKDIVSRIPGIWNERDRIIAHLDRKHVNSPTSVYSNPPIKLDDLHSAIRELRNILLIYNTQLEAGGITIDENQYIWNDLEKLIHLLESENLRKDL
jgi:hypothetical protein